ncbi:hypothetical protein OVA03_12460 [Asticcacaulis sp. SL142]|uniref:hypothetical protein n=1 Tax=Asticcacaulis sp. SL142 TaxID=2995155 RepID=UPI00226C7327|nr:hypothetical protein [Asticcacaulis sp. SL142]WAC47511.1 hypothetical protein OVA03_12460 [Asticcacaulis sp. SL142]
MSNGLYFSLLLIPLIAMFGALWLPKKWFKYCLITFIACFPFIAFGLWVLWDISINSVVVDRAIFLPIAILAMVNAFWLFASFMGGIIYYVVKVVVRNKSL